MTLTKRQRRVTLAFITMLSTAALAGLLIGLLPALKLSQPTTGLLAVLVLAGAFLGMLPRWRGLDHMQRDSRLLSWYWGGAFGGGLGLVLALLFGGARSSLFAGAALVWLLQSAGYGVFRLRWWLAHRPQDS